MLVSMHQIALHFQSSGAFRLRLCLVLSPYSLVMKQDVATVADLDLGLIDPDEVNYYGRCYICKQQVKRSGDGEEEMPEPVEPAEPVVYEEDLPSGTLSEDLFEEQDTDCNEQCHF